MTLLPRFWGTLRVLATLPSPTFRERLRSKLLKKLFAEAGFKILEANSFGTLLAWKGSLPRKAIVVDAHMDTVFEESTPLEKLYREEGDRIWCPGAADNPIGVCALLELARKAKKWP